MGKRDEWEGSPEKGRETFVRSAETRLRVEALNDFLY